MPAIIGVIIHGDNYRPPVRPVAAPPHPDALQWIEENPWFNRDAEMAEMATRAHVEILSSHPHLTIRQNLAYVTAVIRAAFPARIDDYGFLHHREQGWLGCAPLSNISDPFAARQHQMTVSIAQGTLPGREYALIWLMPIEGVAGVVHPYVLGHVVAALDAGQVVCLSAADPADLEPAKATILRISGGAGCA